MSKNYTYAFENLSKGYEALKNSVQPLSEIQDLKAVTEKIHDFTLPRYLGKNTIERWNNLNKAQEILEDATKVLNKLKNIEEKESTPSQQMNNIKIASIVIKRYQQDLDWIMNDLSQGALFEAIKEGKENLVITMLQKNPSLIDSVDIDERGPIHVCAAAGNNKILKLLVEKFKADVNQKTAYNNTPMHIAAEHGNVGTLLELKKLGANADAENKGGHSVIDILRHHEVVISGQLFYEIFPDQDDYSVIISGDVPVEAH